MLHRCCEGVWHDVDSCHSRTVRAKLMCDDDACRFSELTNSLQLYGFDPNTKLHPPRAQRPNIERTLASSNYQSLILQARANQRKMSTWSVIRAVEELIKIHSHENWAASYVKELEERKKHKSFNDVGATA